MLFATEADVHPATGNCLHWVKLQMALIMIDGAVFQQVIHSFTQNASTSTIFFTHYKEKFGTTFPNLQFGISRFMSVLTEHNTCQLVLVDVPYRIRYKMHFLLK